MTKATLKDLYEKFNIKVGKEYHEDTTLEELKELNVQYGNGHRYCSWDMCLIEIIKGGNSNAIHTALELYRKHIKVDTQFNILVDIALATNNFNI